jgi:hypothetical protein
MKNLKKISLVLMVGLCCSYAFAQNYNYQYSVKFVCGYSDGKILGPGVYHTAINIINPNVKRVDLVYKFSVARPGSTGILTDFVSFSLDSLKSFEIDCPEIMKRTRSNTKFLKGFVIIYSTKELDVVAVYTATGRDKMVESIHTERVPARKLGSIECPDLIVETIERPVWEDSLTTIKVTIKNIGSATTGTNTEVELTDPSTIDPSTGMSYRRVQTIPSLDPGHVYAITFTLPYWVFNPDAYIRVNVDYSNIIPECDEGNNIKEYVAGG